MHKYSINCIDFNSDGSILASGSEDDFNYGSILASGSEDNTNNQ